MLGLVASYRRITIQAICINKDQQLYLQVNSDLIGSWKFQMVVSHDSWLWLINRKAWKLVILGKSRACCSKPLKHWKVVTHSLPLLSLSLQLSSFITSPPLVTCLICQPPLSRTALNTVCCVQFPWHHGGRTHVCNNAQCSSIAWLSEGNTDFYSLRKAKQY